MRPTERQAKFAVLHASGLSAHAAALAAGYSPNTAKSDSHEFSERPGVLAAGIAAQAERVGLTAAKVFAVVKAALAAKKPITFNGEVTDEYADWDARLRAAQQGARILGLEAPTRSEHMSANVFGSWDDFTGSYWSKRAALGTNPGTLPQSPVEVRVPAEETHAVQHALPAQPSAPDHAPVPPAQGIESAGGMQGVRVEASGPQADGQAGPDARGAAPQPGGAEGTHKAGGTAS